MTHPTLQKASKLMDGAIDHLKRELVGLRTGRASTMLLDHVMVDYHGTPTPLKQLGTVAAPETRLLTVQPWDSTIVQAVEKAILASGLGLTPSNDGKMVRIPIPQLSEERRKELVKLSKKYGEEAKVQIRGMRRDGNDELKSLQKDAKVTQDNLHRLEGEMQKLTDGYVKKVDDLLKKKEEEILEI